MKLSARILLCRTTFPLHVKVGQIRFLVGYLRNMGIAMERNDRLIRKKIYKYMLTGVMTTIALQLGNVVDAIIVGNLIGSVGNAAVSTSLPYIYTLQAAAILMGSGGALSIAVLLGKRDIPTAGKVMGACIYICIIYPLLFTLASPVLVPAYLRFTGVQGEIRMLLTDYIWIYSIGMPIISIVIALAYYISVDNHPALSSQINIVANVVNLALDYLLVRYTPLGMKGAALSTVLGYLISGSILIPRYVKSKNRMVTPCFKVDEIIKIKEELIQVLKNGLPNLWYLILTVLSIGVINKEIIYSLGADYYTAYAVANNTQHIVQMFLNGITSVIASVAGVLYGEKDYFRIRVVLSHTIKTAVFVGVIIMTIFIFAPQCLSALYGFDNYQILPELLVALRIFALSFFFLILNAISQNYYRTIGQTLLSTLSSTLQLLILRVPLIVIGVRLMGFRGIFIAIVISEILSFAILNIIRIILQIKGRVPKKGYMALPENDNNRICDISVIGNDDSAVRVSEKIIEYCKNEGLSLSKSNMLGVAVEELISNIGRYGYSKTTEKNIDICLFKGEGKMFMRIRDDGIPFNPTVYSVEEIKDKEIGGLMLLKKLAIKITYMRVLDLNNTVFEIDV